MTMRHWMTIMEAAKRAPKPVPVDLAGLATQVKQTANKLVRWPFDYVQFDATALDYLHKMLAERKAAHDRDLTDYPDDEIGPFIASEYAMDYAAEIYRWLALKFAAVRKEVAEAEDDYQDGAAARHWPGEDSHSLVSQGHWIESSDVLTCLHAQQKLADALSVIKLVNAQAIADVVRAIDGFITEFAATHLGHDGSGETVLVESLRTSLGMLMPLLAALVGYLSPN